MAVLTFFLTRSMIFILWLILLMSLKGKSCRFESSEPSHCLWSKIDSPDWSHGCSSSSLGSTVKGTEIQSWAFFCFSEKVSERSNYERQRPVKGHVVGGWMKRQELEEREKILMINEELRSGFSPSLLFSLYSSCS